jgi:aminoglycoside/choline kinase family phosphotransferase
MQTDLLLRQTRLRLPAFSSGRIEISAIEKGGSDRRFYRVRCSAEQSLVLVKYNLEREENRHYVRIAEFLAAHGIRAPKVYFHDPKEGLIWIEDLGETDLFSFRDDDWLTGSALYQSALDEIAKLHDLPEADWTELRSEMPPEFNAALYQWEQNYFFENCLGRIFRVNEATQDKLMSLPALRRIANELASQPRVLVHRDFQSQNIIVRNGQAHVIDFQGMRPGLAEYDLASLLFDPYVHLTSDERDELLLYYLERRDLRRNETGMRERLRFCAMQRLMQALGAYGFLGLAKGNRSFLRHVPAAIGLLRQVIADLPELKALGAALAYLPLNVDVGPRPGSSSKNRP